MRCFRLCKGHNFPKITPASYPGGLEVVVEIQQWPAIFRGGRENYRGPSAAPAPELAEHRHYERLLGAGLSRRRQNAEVPLTTHQWKLRKAVNGQWLANHQRRRAFVAPSLEEAVLRLMAYYLNEPWYNLRTRLAAEMAMELLGSPE